jgi:hypothetical protein
MPIHEYICNLCGRKEERWFANHDEVLAKEKNPIPCKPNPTKCKGFLSRRVSAPNFSVKGYNAHNGYSGKTSGEGTGVK